VKSTSPLVALGEIDPDDEVGGLEPDPLKSRLDLPRSIDAGSIRF
jgi:hypothetical protein